MSQTNALSGYPEQLAQVSRQFEGLYQTEDLVVIGGFGAAALYQAFGWKAPPLSLLDEERRFRKIEVMTTTHSITDDEYKKALGLLEIYPDTESNYFEFEQPGAPALLGPTYGGVGQGTRYLFDPAILRPRERELDGIPVRTLSIGAHLLVTKLIRWSQESDDTPPPMHPSAAYWQMKKEDQENRRYLEQFTEFAEAMRQKYPEEFPALGQEMTFKLAIKAYAHRHLA